jgi:hypothetical protein
MDKYIKDVVVKVFGEVKITDDIREEFKKQYSKKMTDREMAEVIFSNLIELGIVEINHKGFNLDGIGKIQNNIYYYNVKEV